MMRTRTCPTCDEPFSYPLGKGNDRKHCSAVCRKAHQMKLRIERKAKAGPCSTAGCHNKASYSSGICNTCYYRGKRTGSTAPNTATPKYRYVDGAGYINLVRTGHPLADAEGRVREHRFVLYEKLGPGTHPCFWCGRTLDWASICVDHLNEQKADNTPENLVAACNQCNRARGAILPFLSTLSDFSFAKFVEAAREYRSKSPPSAKSAVGSAHS